MTIRIQEIAIIQEPDDRAWSESVERIYLALQSAWYEAGSGVAIVRQRNLDSKVPSCFIVHASSRTWNAIASAIPNSCWILVTGGSAGERPDSVPSDCAFLFTRSYGREANFACWYHAWLSSAFEISAFRSSVTQLAFPIPQSLATAASSLGAILASVCIVIEGARAALRQSDEPEALIQWATEGIALAMAGVDPLEVAEEVDFLRYSLKNSETCDRITTIFDLDRGTLSSPTAWRDRLRTIEHFHSELSLGRDWLAAIAARRENAAKLVLPLEEQLLAIVAALRELHAGLSCVHYVGSSSTSLLGEPAHLLSSRWAKMTIIRAIAIAYPPADRSRWLIRTFVEPGGALYRLLRADSIDEQLQADADDELSRAIFDLSALARFLVARPRMGTTFHRVKQSYENAIASTAIPELAPGIQAVLPRVQEELNVVAAFIVGLNSAYGLIIEPTFIREANVALPAIRGLAATVHALQSGSVMLEDVQAMTRRVTNVLRKFERLTTSGEYIIDIDARQTAS